MSLGKAKTKHPEPDIIQCSNNLTQVVKSNINDHGESSRTGSINNIVKFIEGSKSTSFLSLTASILPWTLTEATERIQKLPGVGTLSNITRNVSSSGVFDYAGGIATYLSPRKRNRSVSDAGSLFSPWALFDNVNQQFDLQANQDELD